MLFQADDKYRQKQSWYNNILAAWKTEAVKNQENQIVETPDSTKLVPAHLHLIFRFENESTIHWLVHSCHYHTEKLSVLTNI